MPHRLILDNIVTFLEAGFSSILFTDFNSYRDRHWVHHNKFGSNEDKGNLEDIKGRKLMIIFIECLFFKHTLIKFFKPIKSNKNKFKISKRILIVQSLFFYYYHDF